MITLADRIGAVRRAMEENDIAVLVAAANGAKGAGHPDAVAHLTGFRCLGESLLVLEREGGSSLIVSPAIDGERAARHAGGGQVEATDDVALGLSRLLAPRGNRPVVTLGFELLRPGLARRLKEIVGGQPRRFESEFRAATAVKTGDEIEFARRASAIAEQGFAKLLELARPGLAECDLATELNVYTKSLGADDNFLMLNSAATSRFGLSASTKPIEKGDTLLVELTPSFRGQFVQICRTVSIGEPRTELSELHSMLEHAFRVGVANTRPGVTLGSVCQAMDRIIIEAGFGEFCKPPLVVRRGHGLGSGSSAPGDVGPDNPTILAEDMLFVCHPNQFLPPTGYLRVGDPVRVTAGGAEVLTKRTAYLGVVRA